ncbi:hypothetical protein BS17DRAFT_772194 [Gyrodon lividus]|nr:hypothetical protein BS17DRAFT_772194 [Gyrodon lividus]
MSATRHYYEHSCFIAGGLVSLWGPQALLRPLDAAFCLDPHELIHYMTHGWETLLQLIYELPFSNAFIAQSRATSLVHSQLSKRPAWFSTNNLAQLRF